MALFPQPSLLQAVGAGALALSLLAYFLYLRLFPRPLPGIPYNAEALSRPLGDSIPVRRQARVTKEGSTALFGVARRLGAPVAQLLTTSWGPGYVIVDDAREAEDILVRRAREFDRSRLTTQFFTGLLPRCTIAQSTTPELRAQKRLWSDAMSADFLRRAVVPNIRRAALELVELWRLKAQAQGADTAAAGDKGEGPRPFEVTMDFQNAALDIIWTAILGSDLGVMRREVEAQKEAMGLDTNKAAGGKKTVDEEAKEHAAIIQEAVEYLNYIVEKGFESVQAPLTMWLLRLTPRFRRIKRTLDGELRRLMADACARFRRVQDGKLGGDEHDTCAMDLVLRREVEAHPQRDPASDPAMLDELLLLLIAGHDSTANTLSWFVKFMAGAQAAQAELRAALRAAFPGDATAYPPSAAAILDAAIPYLDATIEETVRLGATAGVIARRVLVDTTMLGHRVPAGANLVLNTRVTAPAGGRPVPEAARSSTSRAARARHERQRAAEGLVPAYWQGGEGGPMSELETFEPRRWLVRDEKKGGEEVFDAYALPAIVFGGGLRGCFGKKLAYQELRIMIVLLILNFEFLPLPEELTNMDGVEKLFRKPKMCHVRLRAL